MTINSMAISLRAKKLGVLIQNARLVSEKSIEECASVIGVSIHRFEAYEFGEDSPSLPELEVLTFFLGVPLSHFWGNKVVTEDDSAIHQEKIKLLLGLRQRIVGALIRQARMNAGMSLEALAERVELSVDGMEAYELGEAPVPLPALEILSDALSRPIEDFQDKNSPLEARDNSQEEARILSELPQELHEFVSKPVNQPYLELAQRLSEMSVNKLRAVAEGLLEITL